MRKAKRLGVVAAAVAVGALGFPGGAALAAVPNVMTPAGYTCTSGEIPTGTYASITVTGNCSVPADADISVVGDVNVAAGALLDAHSAPSTITVGRNVTAATGSLLFLGCQPPEQTGNSAHPCTVKPSGFSTITVHGNVTATNAHTVLLNGISVTRNVTLTGGGSYIPWAIKNNTIDGNLTVSGQTAEWLGVLFNTVGGNATLTNITVTETHPEASRAVFVGLNDIGRNLTCMGLAPNAATYANEVGHNANGQCAPEA